LFLLINYRTTTVTSSVFSSLLNVAQEQTIAKAARIKAIFGFIFDGLLAIMLL
jgi:hypothetical protein